MGKRKARSGALKERGGEPPCRVVSAGPVGCTAADLVRLLRFIPKPDPGYWDVLDEIVKHAAVLPTKHARCSR